MTYYFGCSNCHDFWEHVKLRRKSVYPIDETQLTACIRCLTYKEYCKANEIPLNS